MASHIVTGDQYRTIDRRMSEIKRMLNLKKGSPLDPEDVARDLQKIIEKQIHRIDCSVQPTIPKGWSIKPEDQIASRFQGELVWDPAKVGLHLDDAQKTGSIVGEDLQKKLEGKLVLPANVSDYLLQYPALIPPDWKWKIVYFWGTIYRDADGNALVPYLFWDGEAWDWRGLWLDDDWSAVDPAAVLAG